VAGQELAREILKKADKGTLTWEKVDGGKIRFTSLGWDDAVVTKPNEVLEIAMLDTIPALVKATKPTEYLDLETSGFVEAGDGTETK
jgi:hypothetical protein